MLKCPNCDRQHRLGHPTNGCVLAALVQVVRERGDLTERRLKKLHENCDVDALWTRLGEVIDDLEDGVFLNPQPEENPRA